MKKQNYFRHIFLTVIALSFYTLVSAQYTKDSLFNDLQVLLDQKRAQYGIEGAAVSVIVDEDCSWTGVSGIRDVGDPVDPNKQWHWASITKSMTAAIILQLVEEGSLSLNDMLGMHFNTAPYPNIDSAISIRSLLNHTNPLVNGWIDSTAFWPAVWNNRTALWNVTQTLQYTPAPIANPNFEHRYQGHINYALLGLVIENITGNSLKEEFENRVFTPLGMTNSISVDTAYNMNNLNGVFVNNQNRSTWSHDSYLTSRGAGSNYIGGIQDATKFMRALHNGEILSPASMVELWNGVDANDNGSFPCGGNYEMEYGLGTRIGNLYLGTGDTMIVYGHSGTGINRSLIYHSPDSNWTIAGIGNEFDNPAIEALVFDIFCYMLANPVDYSATEPVASFSFSSNGNEFTFTDYSINNPDSWNWDFGDGNSSTQANPTHTYAASGTYNVTLTVSNCSGTSSNSQQVSIVGLADINSIGGKVYPNPFTDLLTFEFYTFSASPKQIDIYNVQGNLVDQLFPAYGETKVIWNNSVQRSGIYFYKIYSDHGIVNGKVIKK